MILKFRRNTALAVLAFTAFIAGASFFAYQQYQAYRQQQDLKALVRDCDACARRKAAGQRFRDWLAKQREQESGDAPQ